MGKQSLNNGHSIGYEARELWELLKSRGWKIEIQLSSKNKFPSIWCILYAEMRVFKSETDDEEIIDIYHSHRPVSMLFPFWLQFEEFLIAVDKVYHDTVLPHISGRDDGVPFDTLGKFEDD